MNSNKNHQNLRIFSGVPSWEGLRASGAGPPRQPHGWPVPQLGKTSAVETSVGSGMNHQKWCLNYETWRLNQEISRILAKIWHFRDNNGDFSNKNSGIRPNGFNGIFLRRMLTRNHQEQEDWNSNQQNWSTTVLGTSNDYCISTVVEMDETTQTTHINLMA